MALQFIKCILNQNQPIFNDEPNCQKQVLCEVLTAEGRNEMAYIDADSLTSCGIAIPNPKKILIANKEHRPSLFANVIDETSQEETRLNFCGIGVPGPSTEVTVNDSNANKNDSNEKEYLKFVWSRSSIKCLMSTYVEFEKKFDDSKSTKIQIWNDISAELNKFGFSVTGEMCQRKWRTHTTTYKNIKEKNSKTGRGRDSWEYFDEMESIFSKDPSYTPLATISCGVKSVERHIDSSLYATATGASTNIMPPKSPDEPLAKKQKTNKKKVVSDHLEKIASHMADFNEIFRNLVQSESEKNALLKQLLDK